MRQLTGIVKISLIAAAVAFAYVAGSEHAADRLAGNPALASVAPAAPVGTAVLMLAAPAPAGALGAELQLTAMVLPADQPGEAFLPDTPQLREQLSRAKLIRAVAAGAPLLRADLDIFSAEAARAGRQLEPGMVAMTIPVPPETAVAGLLAPGDRVDVIFTRRLSDGDAEAKLVLTGSRIVTVEGQTEGAAAPAGGGPTSLTLEVMPQAAMALAIAREAGQLSVVLSSATRMTALPFALGGEAAQTPAATPAEPETAQTAQLVQVRVLRMGEPSTYSVRRSE